MNYPVQLTGITIDCSCSVKIVFITEVPPVRFINLLPIEEKNKGGGVT